MTGEWRGALALIGLAASLVGQGATSAAALSDAHGVNFVDGALVGGGPGYRVEFEPGGPRFTPALGSTAPRAYPLRFVLESVRRGDAIVYRASADVAPRHEGDAVVYQRGAITERYELRADGVEQSFRFAWPLGDAGDLVVRGRIETDLTAIAGDTAAGVSFGSAHGGVSFGAVTGVDALGDCSPGSLHFAGSHLELRLPAQFVDAARYPLLLDPLVGSVIAVNNVTNNNGRPDVAYDESNDLYLVVWHRDIAIPDRDILAQRVRADGTLIGGLITVRGTNANSHGLAVGNVDGEDQFLVAWVDTAGSSTEIQCRAVDAATGATSARTTLAAPAAPWGGVDVGGSVRDPQTGACDPAAGCLALVVWDEWVIGGGLRAQSVRVQAGQAPATFARRMTVTSDAGDRFVAISKTATPDGRYLVVWQRDGAVFRVRGACVDTVGTVLDPLVNLGPNDIDRRYPDVDGDGTDFMVAYQRAETPGSADDDVVHRMVHWDGVALSAGAEFVVAGDASEDEERPAVSLLGPKYVVAWQDKYRQTTKVVIATRTFDPIGCMPCGLHLEVPAATSDQYAPRLASQRSGGALGPTDDVAMVVFQTGLAPTQGTGEIRGQRLEAIGSGGNVFDLGGGCGGGTTSSNGPFALGNTNFGFGLSGAPATATAAWLNFAIPQPPIVCGACLLTPPFILVPAALAGGSATVPVAVPCDIGLLGGQLEVQWWTFPGGATPCLPPGLAFANRIQATIGI